MLKIVNILVTILKVKRQNKKNNLKKWQLLDLSVRI